MLFNSLLFVAFFTIVLSLYWLLPFRSRTVFLLVASYVFYGSWDYRFLSLIWISTLVDYAVARALASSDDPRRRRALLGVSIATNLGILGFFKYCNFFIDTFEQLATSAGLSIEVGALSIVLPVGISFYTFQTMSYTIDVYRRHAEPTRDLLTFATFVAFFPQLVAGPIERFGQLFPQLDRPARARAAFARQGMFLLLQGYVKKVAIADNIAPIVDRVFANPGAHDAGQVLEAALLFTAQIYCDFSGYTDIARGAALLLGVDLMANFRAPLLSRSITEFWRRWHVSLSEWLRDYLYIPLGGNRRGSARTYVNLLLTMLIGGLWHGAGWKFVVWGGLHGALLALERALGWATSDAPPSGSPTRVVIGVARTVACFLAVALTFFFFRAADVETAVAMLGIVFGADGLGSVLTLRLFYVLTAVLALDLAVLRTDRQTWILDAPIALRVTAYAAMFLAVLLLSAERQQTFIYFAF